MNMFILLVDFGSTYTKFTAINVTTIQVVAHLSLPTSHEQGIMTCYQTGETSLLHQLGLPMFDDVFICSSAWGGFRMIAIGLTESLTAEAAKRAALGAGTRVVKTYHYRLTKEQVEEMNQLNADIILLSGGTNGGNQQIICHNAKMLHRYLSSGTILVAGNEAAISEIRSLLTNTHLTIYYTKNVMPKVNVLQAEPVRKIAREIFLKKIIHTNGIDLVAKKSLLPIIPTPTSVLLAIQLLADGLPTIEGIGHTLVVDVGGATTDVFSVGNPAITDDQTFFEGLEEPYSKRTVEGDLGMRYSSESLIEAVGFEDFQRLFCGDKQALYRSIQKRIVQPTYLPDTKQEQQLDVLLASNAVALSVNRHVGTLRASQTPNRTIFYQNGKDLRNFPNVIGTGGVLVHHPQPKQILKHACISDRIHLKPISPKFFIDTHYLFSALGLLSQKYPKEALLLLKKMIVPC